MSVLHLLLARPLRALASCVAIAVAIGAPPVRADLQTAEEIEACVDGNLPERSSEQAVVFRSTDRVGAVTESRATIYWQRSDQGLSKVMIRFATPRDLRGAGLLMLEKKNGRGDMFMYLPELKRARRVTTRMMSGSMFGTDFSYEEFERFQGFDRDVSNQRLEDALVDGKRVYVVESRPGAGGGSSYEKILQYIDPETCVPLKTEFYEPGSRIRKVATSSRSSITRKKSGWFPKTLRMRDLRDETETDLIVEKIEIDHPIPRKMFSQRELETGAR